MQLGQPVLQGVLGQVDADEFLFPIEHLAPVEGLDLFLRPQQGDVDPERAAAAEEGHLPGLGRGVGAGAVADHAVERVEDARPRPPFVEHADAGHRLQRSLAHAAQVHAVGQIGGVPERAVGLALVDDQLQRALAGVLDGGQAIADEGPTAAVGLNREIQHRPVDAGGGDGDAQLAGVGDVLGDVVGVVAADGEQGGDVFHRVVGLQIGGLAADDGVVGGVGLVEAVAGEELDVAPDGVAHLLREAAGHGPGGELRLVLVHQVALLLRYGLADHVGFARLVAGQLGGDADDLLLIDEDAVGVLQDRFQLRGVIDGHVAPFVERGVHAADVFGDVLHRAGPEEGDGGDDVVEAARLHLHHQLAHAGAFHLEHAQHVAAAEHVERGFHALVAVLAGAGHADVGGDVVHCVAHAVALLDELRRLAHDGQGAEAEEIDLQQADLLDDLHRPLADGADAAQPGLAAGRPVERHVVHQRLVGDDDAGGVAAGMAGHAFDLPRGVDQFPDARLALDFGVQIGRIELVVLVEHIVDLDRFAGDGGDEAGHGVDFGQGHVEGAADVADGCPRAQRPEGDDLGHLVLAVFVDGVFDHLRAAVVGVVEVDVGHGDAAGVEEAFEDEAVGDGVDAGDAQRVGHQRPGAAAAHVPPDVDAAGVLAQVPDDEEVGVEAHAADDAQLVFQPGAQLLVGSRPLFAVLADEAFLAQGAQIAGRVAAGGHVEVGQVVAFGVQIDIAHFGDEQAVVERAGDVAEQGVHLGVGLEVVAPVAEAHAFGLVDGGAGLDAQKHVVGVGFFGCGVVDVVGGQEAQVVARLHLQQGVVDGREFGDAVLL